MSNEHANRIDRIVDLDRDHVLGNPDAPITLVEYGSYACPFCHAAHEIVVALRDRFGERMRYVFRQRPLTGSAQAQEAAVLAEYAAQHDRFWPVHDALMKKGPVFYAGDFDEVAAEFSLPPPAAAESDSARRVAEQRVAEDAESAARSGARVTPTFFINGRKYEGPWDEASLSEAMLGSLGHRVQAAALDFVRWAPSTGVLLLLMSALAIVLVNSPVGAEFEMLWQTSVGLRLGAAGVTMPALDWINHGLLTMFFLVVGLEIKREFTIGHLATRSAAMLPIAGSIGGMVAPALIYLALTPAGPWTAGWGIPIATDTAFAIALIALLGSRVPIELRIFLTAAVIVDDLIAIAVVALFYSGDIHASFLLYSAGITAALVALNRSGVYRALPYAALGVALWLCLHEAGLHATLAGVILAVVTPTRPPPNLNALMAQADTILHNEIRYSGEAVMRHGPSEPALRALDAIHDRIESPAGKLLRTMEPWSSYVVLPLFAFANAGVVWSADVLEGHAALMLAIFFGLVVGKPAGIALAAAGAVRIGLAVKPDAYSWTQLAGAGALGGIGFTMSLFIAHQAFPAPDDFAAAKIAIFTASIAAGALGVTLLRQPR
jgi:Na+:H+ antiporter, NhaA family